jgi:hypothetical protein
MPLGQMRMRLRLHFESLDLRGFMTGGPARTHMSIPCIHQFVSSFYFCRACVTLDCIKCFTFLLFTFSVESDKIR